MPHDSSSPPGHCSTRSPLATIPPISSTDTSAASPVFQKWIAHPLFRGLALAAISLAVLSAIALKNGLPQPRVQDEFSYLLAADTFAHGRLTNPTPPFPDHFESPHVLVQPTYMSKYPPGQAAALAIGQLLTGKPILGVWLSTAAAIVAIYWMFLAFVPPRRAFFGGFVAAIYPPLVAWGEVYWGGAVAVAGAAILLGAAKRWMFRPNVPIALIAAIGLLVLTNTRPYEGAVLSLPIVSVALFRAARNQFWQPLCAGLAALLVGAIAVGYYNYRVTGHALRMPSVEYSAQYDIYPKFWFLPPKPAPPYHNEVMRLLHTQWEHGDYDRLRTLRGFLQISGQRLVQLISMHAQPVVLLLPLTAGLIYLDAWIYLTLATFAVGILAESWFLPHYAAPLTPMILLLIVIGWRRLGRVLGTLCFIAFFVGTALHLAAAPESPRFGRVDLIATNPVLQTGRHLILVKYAAGHLLDDDWVYNGADLSEENIVWARSLGAAEDAPLVHYFHDRQIWLLEVGEDRLRLNHYSSGP